MTYTYLYLYYWSTIRLSTPEDTALFLRCNFKMANKDPSNTVVNVIGEHLQIRERIPLIFMMTLPVKILIFVRR